MFLCALFLLYAVLEQRLKFCFSLRSETTDAELSKRCKIKLVGCACVRASVHVHDYQVCTREEKKHICSISYSTYDHVAVYLYVIY